jgi:hypothetical protein
VPAPRPSTYRPALIWCSVAAVIASVTGVRPHTDNTPEATWIRLVRGAISASTGVESSPQPSGTAKDLAAGAEQRREGGQLTA